MTKQKNKKRRVRARMAKTGETYQTAHRTVDGAVRRNEPRADFGEELLVIPMRNVNVLKGLRGPFDIGREKSVAVVEAVKDLSEPIIAVFSQRDPATDDPDASDLYPVGCAARLVKATRHESGAYSIALRELAHVRLQAVIQREPYLLVRVARDDAQTTDPRVHDVPTNLDFASCDHVDGEPGSPDRVTAWAVTGFLEGDGWAELASETFEGKPVVRIDRICSMSQLFKADAFPT